MKYQEQLVNVMWLLILISFLFGIGYVIGWNDGKTYERDAILERLEEVDSIHCQDSIKQQRNDKAMKQKIQLTGKNIGDLFRLPCVVEIRKGIVMGEHGDYIPSQNLEDCTIDIVHKPLECMAETRAKMGDWIVEDDNGNWHIEKGGEK